MAHKSFVLLALAIVSEMIGTSCLAASQGFARWLPAVASLVAYGFAFYCLSIPLKTMPVGVIYAIWAGAGVVLSAVVGLVVFRQSLDLPALAGIALIVAGVLVINLLSSSVRH
ncbi:multidrug efflux SMR transporter [Acetobacter sp. TBRC 12305]|uniref:Multidrug efflux SMR transporter n=1 Tax=Acetobacter garciniae TaxID=2817435 RepID=A0A939KQI8_9PROT|nr:multidrug efflux SMR transporter [Acetobacter garciniae]MBO1325392.1 multidrug efflux SMR transporter [Acetobacter garciniae]MBX0345436.1 multidrug efflux SMR transporter [Acetobacter garciniae]